MVLIIGLCGQKQVGKDTVADVLQRVCKFQRQSFASPLKEACRVIFLLDFDQLYGARKDEVDPRWGVTPRELLQQVGTKLFREELPGVLPLLKCQPTLWCRVFTMLAEKAHEKERWVVTDVRFPDEAEAIRSLGGKLIRITRPNLTHDDPHVSEQSQTFDVDAELVNDGSIYDIQQKALSLVRPWTEVTLWYGLRLDKEPNCVEDLENGEVVSMTPFGKRKR